MMYYDRSISSELVDAARPGGPLAWLVQWVHENPETRLDFRSEDGNRKEGGLQLYVGRTSPIKFLARSGGKIRLETGQKYKAAAPGLFNSYSAQGLAARRPDIERHIADCLPRITASFVSGEAIPHNGLMRRYSLKYQPGDLLLAVDSEVKFGFRDDDTYENGSAHKADYSEAARQALALSPGDSTLRKLDTLGVLSDGSLAIVEVKAWKGNLAEAARQTTAHIYNFQRLMQTPNCDLLDVMQRMIQQKVDLGLMPLVNIEKALQPKLVPIIAAPDDHPDWVARWTKAIEPIIRKPHLLDGLRFWRLSELGEIQEEHRI